MAQSCFFLQAILIIRACLHTCPDQTAPPTFEPPRAGLILTLHRLSLNQLLGHVQITDSLSSVKLEKRTEAIRYK